MVRVIKSRRLAWADDVARMEKGRSPLKMFTDEPTGKRPLGMSTCKWMDNIRMDLKGMGIKTTNWVIRLRIGIIGELL